MSMKQLGWIVLAAGILAMAGCGDDDDDGATSTATAVRTSTTAAATATASAATSTTTAAATSTTAAGEDTAAACDAFIAYSRAFDIEEDLEGGIAALKEFAAAASAEIGEALAPTIQQLEEDPTPILEGLEPAPGEQEAQQYVLDHCGDATVDLVAVDYAYNDIASEIDAGRVVFHMENQSQSGEFHEALLLRQHDGVAESPLDQLNAALGDTLSAEAAIGAVLEFELIAVGYVEPEGPGSDYVFAADLEPGTYLLVCLLPQNSADNFEAYFSFEEIPDGQRHSSLGMFAEVSVR